MVPKLPFGIHYGETSRKRVIGNFTLLETYYPPRLKAPKHAHELACLCLVLRGDYREIYTHQDITCPSSCFLFRPAGTVHSHDFDGGGALSIIIELDSMWLDSLREYSIRLDMPVTSKSASTSLLIRKAYREFSHPDPSSALATEGVMLELLALASQRRIRKDEATSPAWLREVRELLHEGFSNRMTVKCIAAEVGTHPVHLARTFHQRYKCTVGDYVRKLRIETACRALASSDLPLSDVALSVGFYDQSHFSKAFRRVTGMSPSDYRSTFLPRKTLATPPSSLET